MKIRTVLLLAVVVLGLSVPVDATQITINYTGTMFGDEYFAAGTPFHGTIILNSDNETVLGPNWSEFAGSPSAFRLTIANGTYIDAGMFEVSSASYGPISAWYAHGIGGLWSGPDMPELYVNLGIPSSTPFFTGPWPTGSPTIVPPPYLNLSYRLPGDYYPRISGGIPTSFSVTLGEDDSDDDGGPTPVPEPTTLLLLGSGLVAAYKARKRH